MKKFDVLIIGGGTAGIIAAAQIRKASADLSVGIIDPADSHFYQPAWTLVGAGTYNYEDTRKKMEDVIPKGVTWIKEFAKSFEPGNNVVETKQGNRIEYHFLIVAPGIKINLGLVEGLEAALKTDSVCSVYTDPEAAFKKLKAFKGGTALFTQPTTPIKCGGAPQKFMYLADDFFRKSGIRKDSQVVYATPGSVIFGLPEIAKTLMEVVDRKDIHLIFGYRLVKVDSEKQIAWYEVPGEPKEYNVKTLNKTEDGKMVGIHYDFMHLAPPQSAPDFIQNSPLASENGWLAVDKKSMQHLKFPNIFGLGDVVELPTAKTGAAVRKQVPVVVANILSMIKSGEITTKAYDGYSSCPIVTGYGKMVLAEFDYDNNFIPDPKLKQMLIFNSGKEHWRLWLLKKYILPWLYWTKMLKGEQV